ncbi:hypothetical protein AU194_24185 [Mycobacterium sp. GA-2829]|nr:hypothetical protein AU194_24185 [Mycobacterium sp. GA-2829]
MFSHCRAASRSLPGLPDGHVKAALANIPPGITFRNGTIRCHFVGGGTPVPSGPAAASAALVSAGGSPALPVGPEPPTVDEASAFL